MSRIIKAGKLIEEMYDASSLLDVGCRDGILKKHIARDIDYFGADLFDNGIHVNYVGDIMKINFDRKFDVVSAIDILEHLDQPVIAFEKLVELSKKYIVVSLPNCYDLKKRYYFTFHSTLGGKYKFSCNEVLDRHRWIMNSTEIDDFYTSLAKKHNFNLCIYDVKYGSSGKKNTTAIFGRFISKILNRKLTAESIIGVFTRHDDR
jgi:hypothetical protein